MTGMAKSVPDFCGNQYGVDQLIKHVYENKRSRFLEIVVDNLEQDENEKKDEKLRMCGEAPYIP